MIITQKLFNKRLILLGLLFFTCIVLISTRLLYMQWYLGPAYAQRAQQNFLRIRNTTSRRGNILDCNGILLATNTPITSVWWQGSGAKKLLDSDLETIALLEDILAISPEQHESLLSALKEGQRWGKRILLAQHITYEQLSKITEQCYNNPHICIETTLKRCYPHKTLGCHLIGYINNALHVEPEGKMGLEKLFEPALRGEQGQLIQTINSLGVKLYEQEIKKAMAGADIVTTLDYHLQYIAEQAFSQEQSGSLLIMDPQTGAIKALISRPMFDPELFLNPISSQEWNTLQEKRPFLNRAFNSCYPPASLYKIVTLSAALENNIITPHTTTFCAGYTRFRGRKYHCANKTGHGLLTISQSIAQSCNIIFFEIAKKISIDTLADYAHRYGLGEKTNILLGESLGLIPTSQWKKATKKESWWPGETLSAVIGQSYLQTTPVQIARMVGGVFYGYLVTPRVLEQEPTSKQPLLIKKETRKVLKKAMKSTVTEGTAIRLSKIEDMKVHAKTGTAQVCSLENQTDERRFSEHAWVTVHFQYKNHSPLLLVMLVENVGSSKIATRIAKTLLTDYKDFLKHKEHKSYTIVSQEKGQESV